MQALNSRFNAHLSRSSLIQTGKACILAHATRYVLDQDCAVITLHTTLASAACRVASFRPNSIASQQDAFLSNFGLTHSTSEGEDMTKLKNHNGWARREAHTKERQQPLVSRGQGCHLFRLLLFFPYTLPSVLAGSPKTTAKIADTAVAQCGCSNTCQHVPSERVLQPPAISCSLSKRPLDPPPTPPPTSNPECLSVLCFVLKSSFKKSPKLQVGDLRSAVSGTQSLQPRFGGQQQPVPNQQQREQQHEQQREQQRVQQR